ncbi:hypothetical protein DL93DRAFT_2101838 [Clavulina sp. PMI_390]|nr:hypothetical protein DL93DRAFT_2101838 [Clavulina sp. PMI_390]
MLLIALQPLGSSDFLVPYGMSSTFQRFLDHKLVTPVTSAPNEEKALGRESSLFLPSEAPPPPSLGHGVPLHEKLYNLASVISKDLEADGARACTHTRYRTAPYLLWLCARTVAGNKRATQCGRELVGAHERSRRDGRTGKSEIVIIETCNAAPVVIMPGDDSSASGGTPPSLRPSPKMKSNS